MPLLRIWNVIGKNKVAIGPVANSASCSREGCIGEILVWFWSFGCNSSSGIPECLSNLSVRHHNSHGWLTLSSIYRWSQVGDMRFAAGGFEERKIWFIDQVVVAFNAHLTWGWTFYIYKVMCKCLNCNFTNFIYCNLLRDLIDFLC